MNLKEWKARLQPGTKLRCVYRYYWDTKPESKPPLGEEFSEVIAIQTNGVWLHRSDLSKRSWMDFPKAAEVRADDKGFELLFSAVDLAMAGQVMSRYEWVT
jgi:hypothetical protein